jgi:hypothetical protein
MKLSLRKIAVVLIAGLCVAWLATVSDEYFEVNAMTGSTRSRVRYAFVFTKPWTYWTTRAEESARRQGIATDAGWQYLSTRSERLFYRQWACGRAPAAYLIRPISPDDIPGDSADRFDRFVAEFAAADEKVRKGMVNAVADGSYSPSEAR